MKDHAPAEAPRAQTGAEARPGSPPPPPDDQHAFDASLQAGLRGLGRLVRNRRKKTA